MEILVLFFEKTEGSVRLPKTENPTVASVAVSFLSLVDYMVNKSHSDVQA